MESLTQFLEKKLKLRVNREKSAVARPGERKFLGLRIVRGKDVMISIAPKSITRFKQEVRRITKRNRGISLTRMIEELNRYTMGWVNYFGIAKAQSLMVKLDSWIRRRLRRFIWKQWKGWRTRAHNLRKSGVGPWMAYGVASGKHGPWNVAGSTAMTRAVPNEYLKQNGYKSLKERYTALASC